MGWRSALVASAAMLFALSACGNGSKASNSPPASAAPDASPEPDAEVAFAAPPDASSPSPCADAGDLFVEVTGDGPVQTYQAGCAYSTIPYGGSQFVGGEGSSAQQSVVAGCAPPSTLNATSAWTRQRACWRVFGSAFRAFPGLVRSLRIEAGVACGFGDRYLNVGDAAIRTACDE
jgi:hypothetical protein